MERYATFFARSRMIVVAFVVAMTSLAVWGLTRLGFDDVPRGLFASDDEAHQRLQLLYEEFGSDDNDVLLVLTAETPGAPWNWFSRERF